MAKEKKLHALLFTELEEAIKFDEKVYGEEVDESHVSFMTRGASCSFVFDLATTGYRLDDIKQFAFLFKQNNTVKAYKLYDDIEEKTINERYMITDRTVGERLVSLITLKFAGADTKSFDVTHAENVKCEILINLDTDGATSIGGDSDIVITQPEVKVIDSLAADI